MEAKLINYLAGGSTPLLSAPGRLDTASTLQVLRRLQSLHLESGAAATPEAFARYSHLLACVLGQLATLRSAAAARILAQTRDAARSAGSLAGLVGVFLAAFAAAGRRGNAVELGLARTLLSEFGLPPVADGGAATTILLDSSATRLAAVDHASLINELPSSLGSPEALRRRISQLTRQEELTQDGALREERTAAADPGLLEAATFVLSAATAVKLATGSATADPADRRRAALLVEGKALVLSMLSTDPIPLPAPAGDRAVITPWAGLELPAGAPVPGTQRLPATILHGDGLRAQVLIRGRSASIPSMPTAGEPDPALPGRADLGSAWDEEGRAGAGSVIEAVPGVAGSGNAAERPIVEHQPAIEPTPFYVTYAPPVDPLTGGDPYQHLGAVGDQLRLVAGEVTAIRARRGPAVLPDDEPADRRLTLIDLIKVPAGQI